MTDQQLTIRVMDHGEIAIAGDWAAAEGWNPGLNDAACFATIGPAGFHIGELDGVAASTISVVNYGDLFAFLGFYNGAGAAMDFAPGARPLPMLVRASSASTAS
jgi:hypothetical protein